MNGGKYALQVDVGLPLNLPLELWQDEVGTPVDLTGCSFEAGIRPRAGVDPLVPLDVEIVDPEAGQIIVSATAEVTTNLAPETARAWNLILTDSLGDKSILIRGAVELAGVIK